MNPENLKRLTQLALEAAFSAGRKILEIYNGAILVDLKTDGSPLTEADSAAHDIIISALEDEGYPIMSEEGKEIPYDERKHWKNYWLVDPLDGTKEFIKRNGEFTVNIAFMENNIPIAGIIYQPTKNIAFAGIEGVGIFKLTDENKLALNDSNKLNTSHSSEDIIRIIASRTHNSIETDKFIDDIQQKKKTELLNAGSSLKFCLLAEGVADIYPRFAPTMEWDTAAGHAILKSAGKNIYVYPSEMEMTYNKPKLINDWFIAR